MNDNKRKKLREAVRNIDAAVSLASILTQQIADQESDSLDNIPENLQYTDRYEAMEDALSSLESALDNLDIAKESWDNAKSDILSAISK